MQRKMDDLGRVTIPMELRNACGIKPNDFVEITPYGDGLILRKPKQLDEQIENVRAIILDLELRCDANAYRLQINAAKKLEEGLVLRRDRENRDAMKEKTEDNNGKE